MRQQAGSARFVGAWALLGCPLAGHVGDRGSQLSGQIPARPENLAVMVAAGWVIKEVRGAAGALLSTSWAPTPTPGFPPPGT